MSASQTILLREKSGKIAYGIVDGVIFRARTGSPDASGGDGDDAIAREFAAQPGAQRIPLGQLAKAQFLEDPERSIRISPAGRGESELMVDAGDDGAQQRFMSALRASLPGLEEGRGTSLGAALGGPLLIGGLVAVLSFVVYSTAREIDAGTYTPTDRQGRARTIAKLAASAAGILGTTGTVVAGIVLLALCVAWLVYELKHVCNVVTLKPR
jgi:hypothetical protein